MWNDNTKFSEGVRYNFVLAAALARPATGCSVLCLCVNVVSTTPFYSDTLLGAYRPLESLQVRQNARS